MTLRGFVEKVLYMLGVVRFEDWCLELKKGKIFEHFEGLGRI